MSGRPFKGEKTYEDTIDHGSHTQISLFVPEIVKFFKICKLAKGRRRKLNQILIKYEKQGYLSQFLSEMLDFLQYDSTRGAL